MVIMIFYFVKKHQFSKSIIKLKPTGKWKIDYEPYISLLRHTIDPVLYIQHQGSIFKYWVNENDIVGSPVPLVPTTNKCTSKFHQFGQSHEFYHFGEFKK